MKQHTIEIPIYRFKFSDDVIDILSHFAKIHQYDKRKDFKEAWQKWLEEDDIKKIINNEIHRLEEDGYDGDILDKMFKSARYYYRKKSNEAMKPKKRKTYVGFTSDFLEIIDKHILEEIQSNVNKNNNSNIVMSDIYPAEAYIKFCRDYRDVLQKEINILVSKLKETNDIIDPRTISIKFKKTYKNRFFNIRSSNIILHSVK